MDDLISLNPVSGWAINHIKAHEAMFIKFDFLTSPMQPLNEANQSPNFLLTVAQAEELAMALTASAQKVRSAEFQATPGPKH
jgi:biofilm regulator BssS